MRHLKHYIDEALLGGKSLRHTKIADRGAKIPFGSLVKGDCFYYYNGRNIFRCTFTEIEDNIIFYKVSDKASDIYFHGINNSYIFKKGFLNRSIQTFPSEGDYAYATSVDEIIKKFKIKNFDGVV